MSGGGGGSSVIGYRYLFGILMGICRGPVDAVIEARVGDRTAWVGNITDNTSVDVDAYNLFGGETGEGGVQGRMDVMFGGPNQLPSSSLTDMLNRAELEDALANGTARVILTDQVITGYRNNSPTGRAAVQFRPDGTVWKIVSEAGTGFVTTTQIAGVWATSDSGLTFPSDFGKDYFLQMEVFGGSLSTRNWTGPIFEEDGSYGFTGSVTLEQPVTLGIDAHPDWDYVGSFEQNGYGSGAVRITLGIYTASRVRLTQANFELRTKNQP